MKSVKFGIVVFPGSNCDHDCYHAVKHVFGQDAEYVWHKESNLKGFDCIILPGGFSYGDYLRTGAIARLSPVMGEVVAFAKRGGPVLGICNGFQILTEIGLLPGLLMMNRGLKFVCDYTYLKVENSGTIFTGAYEEDGVVRIPVAHADGNYYADDRTLQTLEDNNRIVFRYATEGGRVTDEANPNGSRNNIAAIINEGGNVLGTMPHPERACESILDGDDGGGVFTSLIKSVAMS